jgi:hypothetical protein
MADVKFDDFDADGAYASSRAGIVGKIVNGAGALTSVALILGLAVWGYKLAVRDVTGIPVIQALEGPARVAPDNPGGQLAEHTGLAVNTVAAVGSAAAPADRLVLAPRETELTDEDLPMGAADASLAMAPAPEGGGPETAVLAALPVTDAPLGEGAAAPEVQEGSDTAAGEDLAPAEVIPADVPGVSRSLRPQARPAGDAIAEAAAAAVAAAMAPAEALDIEPDTLAEGTRLVQLGAFDSPETAKAEWDRVAGQFGPLLDGKRRVIQPATGGGQTFYRLRVQGFADINDARRFCAALLAENASCVPAQVR